MPWSADQVPAVASDTRTVKLRYFAWVREKMGRAEETAELPPDIATVTELVSWLKGRGGEYGEAFARANVIRVALDQKHARPADPIGQAREIAFFPPVTGG